jgi:hypothetical protein
MIGVSIEQQQLTALCTIEGHDKRDEPFDYPMAFEVQPRLYDFSSAEDYRWRLVPCARALVSAAR